MSVQAELTPGDTSAPAVHPRPASLDGVDAIHPPPLVHGIAPALGEAAGRRFDHLRALEAESIHIMREVVAEFERPVMLYSIGKD